ncbi:MAG: cupin domain-containing protein [Taibaiella sp.]|jgi:quercetin dioxygenase-like cupin family protein
MRPTEIITIDAHDGQSYSIAGNTYRIIVSGEQTGGAYAAIDMLVPPNGGPGPHAHKDMEESFYVLEGKVTFRSESQVYIAEKGSYVNIPRGGAVHSFKNESDTMARLLCMVAPAGLEAFFREVGRPVPHETFLPAQEANPDELKQVKQVAAQYGQEFFPPDYLNR